MIKEYIPLIQTLIGGLLAFLGGLLSNTIIQKQQRKSERNSLASAFYGEIQALMKIVERRRYTQKIQESIKAIRLNEINGEVSFSIRVTRKYFNVYEKNLDKIGILPNPLPEKIVDIYTVMTAILEDLDLINEESFWRQETELIIRYLTELEVLFKYTIESGHGICKDIKRRKLLV